MPRAVEHRVGRALLGDARGIHDDDAVGIAGNHAEIVGNDDERDVELARQILHQLENLRLDGDVERGGGLVGDDQLGIAGKPDRDHHTLPHAARELMRVLIEPPLRIGDADQLQEFDCARLRFRVGHAEMDLQRLFYLKADREDRVQRRHRLLEDHRNIAAADFAHLLIVEIEQRAAVEYDAALRDFCSQAWQAAA